MIGISSMIHRVVVALSLLTLTTSFQSSNYYNTIRYNNKNIQQVQQSLQTYNTRSPRHERTSLNALTPAATLSAIGSPLGSIAVLAFVILVHESGHFLAARSLGINVDEFSVGVGPRIIGVRRQLVDDQFVYERINDSSKDDEDDTTEQQINDGIEFSLRAIPLGGYVRFPENYNRTLAFEQEDIARNARNEARRMRIEDASPLQKTLESVAAKSLVFNILSLGLLKKWQQNKLEEQIRQAEDEAEINGSGSNKSAGKKASWLSVLPWVGNNKEEKEDVSKRDKLVILNAAKPPLIDYFDDENLLQNRPPGQRALVLSGGVIFNIILAFACYFGELQVGRGLPSPVFDSGAIVSQGPSRDSPSFGILKQGDAIIGVNDMMLSNSKGSSNSIWNSQKTISSVISSIRETPDGESIKLTIVHGKNTDSTEVINITPKQNTDGVKSIGVMLGPNYVRTDVIRGSSFIDAANKAGSAVYQLTSETARSITGLLVGMLLGKGLPVGTSMSGPIGVVKSGADVVKSSDFSAVVAFAASISINLAVVNSLPLPALDGGQLAFVLAEAAAGRKIDQRVQEGINSGALLILLLISAGTAVGDVTSIFK